MSPLPLGEPSPDTDMLVRPVYLAGRGDTTTIHEPLSAAHGWGTVDTDTGLMFTSPRGDTLVASVPESRYGGWKITQYREPLGMPVWSASFSQNTPAEITSAFTRALATGLPSHHRDFLHGGPHHRPASPARTLADRGWHTEDTASYLYQYAPDGHAYFRLHKDHLDHYTELEGGGPAQWTMYGCVERVNGERWHADFTSTTPLYLVHEAVLALSSTDPVERPLHAIPERNLPYITARPANAGPDPRRSAALARTTNAPHNGPAAPAAQPAGSTPAPAPPHRR
ncbi:DUF317 domain-containing protein [Streptomyces sp. NPDC059568]|uniref:DUF317 domain-containing protein n=1 Tax=Streptomyces sp. NPDC059568 TaxID=3346868 RepID=UPI00367698C0